MQTIKHLTTQQKYADLEVHVRVVEADGTRFVDIRDFVPSTELYGRGIMLPLVGGFSPVLVREVALAVNIATGLATDD